MDSPHRHTDSSSSLEGHLSDDLDPSMVQSMPIEDVLKALEQRALDPQPSLDWVKHKQKRRPTNILSLTSPALRIAATLLLLLIATVLFTRPAALPEAPPQIAIDPPLGTLYLTAAIDPVFKPANFDHAEALREEYIIDEINGPFPDIYARVAPYGKVLHRGSANPSLEVIAFGDPTEPASQALYDDLKSLATTSENARFLFVSVSSEAYSEDVQHVLSVLGVDSMPAVFVNGNPVML